MIEAPTNVVLNSKKAGYLNTLIKKVNRQIEVLIIKGKLNGTDFMAIRGQKELTHLDISECILVGGGRSCIIMDGKEKIKCEAKANELSDYILVCMESNKQYKEIILPEGIKRIGECALAGHHALKSIIIPDSVEEIDDSAFWCCSGLTQIKLGKNLKRIGKNAFGNLLHLTELEIPASVQDIDEYAFNETSLKVIRVLNPIPPTLHFCRFEFLDPVHLFKKRIKRKRHINLSPLNCPNAILIVPKGSLTRYKRAAGWKKFKEIVVE